MVSIKIHFIHDFKKAYQRIYITIKPYPSQLSHKESQTAGHDQHIFKDILG